MEKQLSSLNFRKSTDPEKVFDEITRRVNDAEIMAEINEKFNFSGDKSFIESFKENYTSNIDNSSIFNRTLFDVDIEALDADQIYTIAAETIVMKYGRPSLLIQNGKFEKPESDVWKGRLHHDSILDNIPSVGRIELQNHATYDWVGTGWLLENSEYLITNRHVAKVFAKKNGNSFVFKQNLEGRTIKSFIDYKEEFGVDEESSFRIDEIVHIAKPNEPDVAIMRVNPNNLDGQILPEGLKISDVPASLNSYVYTLGYPAKDSRIRDSSLMERIFKSVYNVKRLAPGKLINTNSYDYEYHHDCSTLGGNSGSPVIDLQSGKVVGLHHAGTYRKYNWAVQCEYLLELITSLSLV
ncbi:serine protease [Aquimarina sp. BL5]|uniref:trypsin-like serine peptidase n=1 Tax=Aquimarina sp. BL5 TaxID=1714860 RepID=UPI000E5556DC|nr:serine protease [Aquimarina sp. BL5]AXT52843.1 serine protease [Aquimarina sp. BL5]RKN08827.1 serine protease [Aquimarina sp. BL5]